ncbi:kinase-like protein, partial [Macrolepiota fuliginosa MF-IS2]
ILSLLYRLATSALVFPRRYLLSYVRTSRPPIRIGGFADGFLGQYMGHKVSVKIFRTVERHDPSPTRAVSRELVLWAHLSHPNILPFSGVYSSDQPKTLCLLSPWMENGTLPDYLRRNRLEDLRTLLVSDIVNGLCYLHSIGVIHGDLKGQNILISDDRRALISDFVCSHTGLPPQKIGTMRWSPPEVLEDENIMAPSGDIWSFGCICYEVFAGRSPFYEFSTNSRVAIAIVRGAVPRRPEPGGPDHIDDTMWDLMLRCWRHEPQDRPTCEELRLFFDGLKLLDDRPGAPTGTGDDHAYWKDELDERLDYERAYQILV